MFADRDPRLPAQNVKLAEYQKQNSVLQNPRIFDHKNHY